MAKTARQIIASSLRKIGALASGETATADEMKDALSAMQGMVDTWSNNDLLAYTETTEVFPLVPNQSEYTIGIGGDLDTARPMEIKGISVRMPSGLEIPLNPLTFDQWREIALKTVSATFPNEFYFRKGWPLGTIFFFPVPLLDYEIIVYSRKPLINIASLNQEVDLPEGYERALIYNLCFDLVDEYGGEVSASVAKIAGESLSAIKATNLAKNIPYAASDAEFCGDRQRSGWILSDFLKGGG